MKEFVSTICKGANWCAGLMAGGIMTSSVYGLWMRAADKKGVSSEFGIHTAGMGIAGLVGTIAGGAITRTLNKAVDGTFNNEKED